MQANDPLITLAHIVEPDDPRNARAKTAGPMVGPDNPN